MKKKMMNLLKQIVKSILIIIGAILLILFIYFKVIRERLPKDIPFTFTEIGFVILLYIISMYIFSIRNLLFKTNRIPGLSFLINILYLPLKTFDQSLKNNAICYPYYKRILLKVSLWITSYFPLTDGYSYLKLYVIVQIIPRMILVSALLADTFYFHRINILYKVILISLILLATRYIKYSFKYALEQNISKLKTITDTVSTDMFDPEYYPNDMHKFFNGRSVEDYIFLQTDEYEKKYVYVPIKNNWYLPKEEQEEFKEIMEQTLELSIHISKYRYAEDYTKCKKTKAGIFALYLISWVYILIISIYALPMDTYINMWDWIIQEMPRIKEESIEPFTGIELEIESGKSKLGSILNRVE